MSTRTERMLCQSSVKSIGCRQIRLQEDARTSCPQQCCSGQRNASADSASSTTPLARTTQLKCGKPRAVTTDAAKVKQVEVWQLAKRDAISKSWKARVIQLEVRVGAKRECLPKLGARLKHHRIGDDAEDERNEEVLRKPWSISVEETDRARSATRQL